MSDKVTESTAAPKRIFISKRASFDSLQMHTERLLESDIEYVRAPVPSSPNYKKAPADYLLRNQAENIVHVASLKSGEPISIKAREALHNIIAQALKVAHQSAAPAVEWDKAMSVAMRSENVVTNDGEATQDKIIAALERERSRSRG